MYYGNKNNNVLRFGQKIGSTAFKYGSKHLVKKLLR